MSTTQRPAVYAHVDERYAAARRMLAVGDATRAIELLDGRADHDETGEAQALLGDAYFLAAQYDRAEAAWRARARTRTRGRGARGEGRARGDERSDRHGR